MSKGSRRAAKDGGDTGFDEERPVDRQSSAAAAVKASIYIYILYIYI